MEDNEGKMNKEQQDKENQDTKKYDTENRMIKKMDFASEPIVNVSTMKSLGLDKITAITRNIERLTNVPNMERDLGLSAITEMARQANQFSNISSMPNRIGLGDMYRELDSPFAQLSKLHAENGFVNHANAAQAAMASSIFRSLKPFQLANQLKAMDGAMPFRELANTLNVLKNSSIPHMSFYRGILDKIDEGTYKRMTEELADEVETEEVEEDGVAEDATVIRPECYNVALTINMYVTVTENHVQSSPDVTEEDRAVWMKVVKPVVLRVVWWFLSWAFGYSMNSFMDHVEPFKKIAEISEAYHHPIETTDVEDVGVKNES